MADRLKQALKLLAKVERRYDRYWDDKSPHPARKFAEAVGDLVPEIRVLRRGM